MTSLGQQENNWSKWGVLVAIIVAVANLLFSAGVIWTTVQGLELRTVKLELRSDSSVDRLARIEVKLETLIEDQRAVLRSLERQQ